MSVTQASFAATNASTQYVQSGTKTIAYRFVGSGQPLLLCNRFRGTLDTWDPLFLEELSKSFRVIYFDYASFGSSTGPAPRSLADMVDDMRIVADGLGLERFVLCGWSIGGLAVQAALALMPARITHLIILGSNPSGAVNHPPEPIFLETALKPINDLADETVLFFEPGSKESTRAAKESHDRIALRRENRSPDLTPEQFLPFLKAVSADRQNDAHPYRGALRGDTPMLALCGDHDVSFPVENWYDASRQTNVIVTTFPGSGHGPHHQFPEVCAGMIVAFVRSAFVRP